MSRWFLILLAASSALAQPAISPGGIYNSASWRPAGLPGAGIARGAIFTVYGTGLGPGALTQAKALPLATSLGGASVSVKVGDTAVDALILFAYSTQINAILPSRTPAGDGVVTVAYDGRTSAPEPIRVVPATFGIYTFNAQGAGQAIATDAAYLPNSIVNSFHPGDWVTLWGTGLGPISASDADAPPVGNLPGSSVHVGATTVAPYYAGRSAAFPGLDQVAFQVPAGIQGCAVPVAVETGGLVSNIATIAVAASGRTCPDSILGADLIDKLAAGNKIAFGYVRLESLFERLTFNAGTGGADFFYGSFSEFTRQTAGNAVYGVSPGYCVAGPAAPIGFSDLSLWQLDAGPTLQLQGPFSMSADNTYGFYRSYTSATGKALWSGMNYTVSATGGKHVGAFSVPYTTSARSVAFSNVAADQKIPTNADLTVKWSGADPSMQDGQVTIIAYSTPTAAGPYAQLQCTAPAGATSMTIPAWVLAQLPPAGSALAGQLPYSLGWIMIGQYNKPTAFQPPGLDRALLTDAFFTGFAVYFQ